MTSQKPTPKDPRLLGNVLNAMMKRLKSADVEIVGGVFGRWREVVGESIADNVTPVRIEGKKLTVEVADQAWATQLRFLEKDLLHTLQQHFGDAIESIDIRVRRYR
ncbi:hypothetical protein LBMAG13_09920 [Actinomycetes bacterium]|nr:hypothetical protein LBMAG13_09920 [Actinomycetes bacterium]